MVNLLQYDQNDIGDDYGDHLSKVVFSISIFTGIVFVGGVFAGRCYFHQPLFCALSLASNIMCFLNFFLTPKRSFGVAYIFVYHA